jgi:hypothetical protein
VSDVVDDVIDILNEMREHGVGHTLYYAERLAQALGEPPVITQEVLLSGRLTR